MMDVEGAAGSSGSTPRSPRTTGVVRRQKSARSTSQGDGQEGCSYASAVSGRSFRPVSAESRVRRMSNTQYYYVILLLNHHQK